MNNVLLRELLKCVGEGQHDAFTDLYKLTHSPMRAAAIKILFRQELADEIVQEAFVQIWLNAASFKSGKAKALTWMIRIARYRALDCLRYQKVRKEVQLFEHNLPETPQICPFIEIENQQLLESVDKLRSKHCESIKLVYYSGLTHSEVKNHMNEPLGTIKSWLKRGLDELRVTSVKSAVGYKI